MRYSSVGPATLCSRRRAVLTFGRVLYVVTNREQFVPRGHVLAMELAAFVFEAAHQSVEMGGDTEVRRARRALHRSRSRNEDFEVVHASEQILRLFQRADARGGVRPAKLARNLHPVAQLFDHDAHVVQAIRQVDARRMLNGDTQADGAARGALVGGGDALGIRKAAPRGVP